jgi:Ca2+-binding EF-hand superfamily protein
MAAGDLTDDQLEDLRQSFLLFDRSGDGAVDFRDLRAAFRVLGQNPRDDEIRAIEKSVRVEI